MPAKCFLPLLALSLICCGSALLAASPPPDPDYKLVLQAPPALSVNSVVVSPDGSLVATASGEGGVRLCNSRTGELLRTIGEAGDRGVIFSPNGRTLTAAGFHMDKLVGVFDVQTGRRVLALAGHTEWEADATALSPDGELLASTGTDKQILVWELATGKLRHQLKDQAFRTAALAFSPDSATLAGGGGDKLVRLWDSTTGQLRRSLAGHRDWIATLTFSPDGRMIASGSCDWGFHRGHDWVRPAGSPPEQSEWRLWDVDSGQLQRVVTEQGRMLSVAFAPSGNSIACGIDKDVRLYDLSTNTAGQAVTSHTATVTSVAFTPDGAAVISGSHDQTVKRTNLATGMVEWRAPGYFEHVNSVALSRDGSLLATGSSDHRFASRVLKAGDKALGPGAVRLWDARTGRLLRRLGDPGEQVMAVALSFDGRHVVSGGASPAGSGVVRVWDTTTGKPVWSQADHTAEVLAVAFAPDGSSLATACADGLMTLRDPTTGKGTRTLGGHMGGATSVAFSTDGSLLVCGEGHGATHLWDARTGRLLQTCKAPGSQAESYIGGRLFNSIGLSQDGGTLATCTASLGSDYVEPVRIWDARTGALKRDFAAEKIHGRPMALSPDGSILATGGKTVRLWDVRTGTMLRELFGHLKRTQSIAFSADGRLLFSGGSYGTTNAWEVATGRHLVTLFAFSQSREGATADDWLAYHPDGYYDGSPGVERYLAWRVGEELQTPETLRPKLHRPERIVSALNLDPLQAVSP